MTTPIDIDPGLVERSVMELAQFGAWGETGVWRPLYTPEWVGARDKIMDWFREAGLATRQDAVGNVWGKLEGREKGRSIVTGSHHDTQKPGGRYDGALGVIAGLIAVQALKAEFGPPRRPVEVLALCEEESSRFSANFWGSRAIIGNIKPGDPVRITNPEGENMADVMRSVGLDPERCGEAKRDDIEAFLELHIEQGPVLEQADCPVAVVTGITGFRLYRVALTGVANHAGACPMDQRRDPLAGLFEIAGTLTDTAHRLGRPTCTTIGQVLIDPNQPTIIPGKVEFTVDVRHPEKDKHARLLEMTERTMRAIAERRGLGIDWTIVNDHAPCPCDGEIMGLLRAGAAEQGVPVMAMHSGAAHDSQQIGKITRVAMVFVRSRDGRSHCQEEFSSVPDMVDGIKVLAAGLHKLAW